MSEVDRKSARRPRTIAGYEILRRLGRGAMGTVFLARQISLDRKVALKVLAARFAKNEPYVRRFLREAHAAAKLHHPNIITAYDVGEVGQVKYFVMEYVDGPTAAELLERRGAVDEATALSIAASMARALDHANENGFVHRDVKPANIILTPKGVPKLLDLGLAKEMEEVTGDTQEGQTLGTPDYIAPEQARGDRDVDIRVDIYSLGATLFHLVTGEVPFKGPTPAVVMAKHLTEERPDAHEVKPEVSRAAAAVIKKMMARDRERRFQTPKELLHALTAVQNGKARKPMPVLKRSRYRGRKRRRR